MHKNPSNSAWVKREVRVPVVEGRSIRVFSGKKPLWGKHDEKRKKIIPTSRVLYIIKFPPGARIDLGRDDEIEKSTQEWHRSSSFVKLNFEFYFDLMHNFVKSVQIYRCSFTQQNG